MTPNGITLVLVALSIALLIAVVLITAAVMRDASLANEALS